MLCNEMTVCTSWLPKCDKLDTSWHASGMASTYWFPDLTFRLCYFLKGSSSYSLHCVFTFKDYYVSSHYSTLGLSTISKTFVGGSRELITAAWGLDWTVHWMCHAARVQQVETVSMKTTSFFIASSVPINRSATVDQQYENKLDDLARFPNIKRVFVWPSTGILSNVPAECLFSKECDWRNGSPSTTNMKGN